MSGASFGCRLFGYAFICQVFTAPSGALEITLSKAAWQRPETPLMPLDLAIRTMWWLPP